MAKPEPLIHHDNAPAHRYFKVSQFLAKNKMTVIPQPPYSPDLAPCDFSLFPKLKLRMKGRRFNTTEEIQKESQRVLDTIPKKDFQEYFQAWQTTVFVQMGSVLKVMVEFNIQGKQTSFYKYCPGTLGYTLVHPRIGEYFPAKAEK